MAVDSFMTTWLDSGNGLWMEDTATDLLLTKALPRIQFRRFTGSEEASNGADWLWWWVDRDGTCFGLLVQAKVLKLLRKRWSIDFAYKTKNDDRTQISKLLKASDQFDVPAAYTLYCGDVDYRASIECDRIHQEQVCKERNRAGVAILSALLAQNTVALYGRDAGVPAFHDAVPLEDIAAPATPDVPIVPLVKHVADDLAGYLREPQRGARRVAKELLRPVQTTRYGQFSAATMRRVTSASEHLFEEVPDDRGHFPVPYYVHLLRGLRSQPPDYVRAVLEGRPLPSWLAQSVAGIVVIPDADAHDVTAVPSQKRAARSSSSKPFPSEPVDRTDRTDRTPKTGG